MPSNRRRFTKPWRPIFQPGHPLARGVVFAIAPWLRGVSAAAGLADKDERTGTRGDVLGSISGIYDNRDMGIVITAGISIDSIAWLTQAVRQAANIGASGRWTMAILYNTQQSVPPFGGILAIKGTDNKAANSFGYVHSNRWEFYTSDAVSNDVNIGRNQIVGQTYFEMSSWQGAAGGNISNNSEDGHVVNIAVPSFPNPTPGNFDPITIFGSLSNTNKVDAEIGMLALWNRTLPLSAHEMMYRDPYTLWRPITDDAAQSDEIAAAAFIHQCCCAGPT